MSTSIFCVISHETVLERIHEVESGKALIGRCDDSEIWLPDPRVSREHAVLSWTGDRASVLDLGSRNGTLINGRRIKTEELVGDGSEVRVGPYTLQICFEIGAAIRSFVNSEISTRIDASRPMDPHAKYPTHPDLTPAQRRVYEAFVEGLSEREVGERLKISVHTVHTHAKAIYKTFAISSRAELMRRWAAQQGNDGAPSPSPDS